ncbi:AAA family ATPase [Desulfobulbus sp. F1]|nr:AAA family ATPase [Desulfobulbus sp. F1]
MICSIQKISSFGVFDNFQWSNELPDFKQFNLIYGWNYSGKTTLSRAFRCFEQKKHHKTSSMRKCSSKLKMEKFILWMH